MAPIDPFAPLPEPPGQPRPSGTPSRAGSRAPSIIVAVGAALGLTLAGLGVAAAQDDGTTDSTVVEEPTDDSSESGSTSDPDAGSGETPLSGTTADQVAAAALEAVPGGTVLRVETDADGAAYEAHVRTAEGDEVIVTFTEDLEMIEVQEHGGHHGRGGEPCPEDENDDGDTGAEAEGTSFDA